MKLSRRLTYVAAFVLTLLFAPLAITSCAGTSATVIDAPGAAESDDAAASREYPGKYDGELFFWELTSDAGTVHVLGSVHLAPASIYPLDERIIRAFASSDLLIEEVDIANADMLAARDFINSHSILPLGREIADYLSEAEVETLTGILESYGIPYDTVRELQPWVIANTLALMSSYETDLDPSYGIDVYFAAEAADLGMEIYALETVVGQLEIISSISLEAQAWSLSDAIAEFANLEGYLEELISAWETGDMQAMERIMTDGYDDPSGREYYDALLRRRNGNWRDQILQILSADPGREIFLVAGTGHMVGPDNLIDLLIAEGFIAKRF
jgi:uncharacterized protein YbaP (TraB family)